MANRVASFKGRSLGAMVPESEKRTPTEISLGASPQNAGDNAQKASQAKKRISKESRFTKAPFS
jgi:hypothetical protein